ncbi:hypothetical protein [Pseudorhodoplanes sp.]|uniref:hypothetical protein n=1 Tax=Pseudorhodoplanes sp. TaxID=1934341 RepID=UPI003D108ADE
MARPKRSLEHHLWAARDGRRAVLAAIMLIFVIATSLSDGRLLPDFAPDAPPASQAGFETSDDDLRTGSILITPPDGNVCEHRLIDNQTWRIRPNGTVQCDAAVTWHHRDGTAYTAQTRIEAIRDGFVAKR